MFTISPVLLGIHVFLFHTFNSWNSELDFFVKVKYAKLRSFEGFTFSCLQYAITWICWKRYFQKKFQQHSPRWWLFMVIYHCRIRKKKHIQPVRLFGLRSQGHILSSLNHSLVTASLKKKSLPPNIPFSQKNRKHQTLFQQKLIWCTT